MTTLHERVAKRLEVEMFVAALLGPADAADRLAGAAVAEVFAVQQQTEAQTA